MTVTTDSSVQTGFKMRQENKQDAAQGEDGPQAHTSTVSQDGDIESGKLTRLLKAGLSSLSLVLQLE